MVLIMCTKNESNLIIRYCDMVPDRQKSVDGRTEWTDGRTDDAKTISLRLCRAINKRTWNTTPHLHHQEIKLIILSCH